MMDAAPLCWGQGSGSPPAERKTDEAACSGQTPLSLSLVFFTPTSNLIPDWLSKELGFDGT